MEIVEYYHRFGLRKTAKQCLRKTLKTEEAAYYRYRREAKEKLEKVEQGEEDLSYQPLISILVPLYQSSPRYLKELICSVQKQTYQNYELCLSDGGSAEEVRKLIKLFRRRNKRIRYMKAYETRGISENTNRCEKMASGEFLVFLDHDDTLAPNALMECVKELNHDPSYDLLYSDEDKMSDDGRRFFQPHFKSDYNKDLFLSMNYICHLVMVRRTLFEKVGGLRPAYDGAQDYDFLIRCVEQNIRICHIPKILYHWRMAEGSTAAGVSIKEYAVSAGREALEDYLKRNHISGKACLTEHPGIYRIRYDVKNTPMISILIPNKDHIQDLEKCIRSIHEKGGYEAYEIIVIENNSIDKETFAYYDRYCREDSRHKVVYWEKEFNFSSIINYGAAHALGDYLFILNNDVELLSEGFLAEMLSYAQREDVGIVGNILYYPNNIIQHAGVIVGYSGIAGHAFIGECRGMPGYFSRIITPQDYSAVTAACMMVKTKVFQMVGGFQPEFKVAFNDIDFCLRVREKGYLVVYDPYAEAYHYESKSRGSDQTGENLERFRKESDLFREKWEKLLKKGDPYYNVNLTLDRPDFSLPQEIGFTVKVPGFLREMKQKIVNKA